MQGVYDRNCIDMIILRKKLKSDDYFIIRYPCEHGYNYYIRTVNDSVQLYKINDKYDMIPSKCDPNMTLEEYKIQFTFNTLEEAITRFTQGLQPIIILSSTELKNKHQEIIKQIKTIFREK